MPGEKCVKFLLKSLLVRADLLITGGMFQSRDAAAMKLELTLAL